MISRYNLYDMTKPKLILAHNYIDDVIEEIEKAKTRICIVVMVIIDDQATHKLTEALKLATSRGIKVEMSADVFTYAELSGFIFPTRYVNKAARETNHMVGGLIKSGVKFAWLGTKNITIFNGRTHDKWCVIDDVSYTFGGVNLHQEGIDNNDYMFKIWDKDLAEKLVNEYRNITKTDGNYFSYRSDSTPIKYGELLFDRGIIGDSLIYRRACKLTSMANSVVLVSQYCPTGRLSKLLKNTDSRLYFNPARNARKLNRIMIMISLLFTKNKTYYTKKQYLHAKFMIFTMPGGKKIAIAGSHNFIRSASLLGTKEVAIQTSDKSIISQLESFMADQVI